MSSKWLLTLRADCDLDRLKAALAELQVQLNTTRPPLPMGDDGRVVVVDVPGAALPDAVAQLDGVLRVNPSSRMARFGGRS